MLQLGIGIFNIKIIVCAEDPYLNIVLAEQTHTQSTPKTRDKQNILFTAEFEIMQAVKK
jgi:hypothetical protein